VKFTIKPTNFFLKQIDDFDDKTKRILLQKLDLIKYNPFRYKAIHTSFGRVFSVRFDSGGKAERLVYLVKGNLVIICFVLDRDKDYNDLDSYFKKILDELA